MPAAAKQAVLVVDSLGNVASVSRGVYGWVEDGRLDLKDGLELIGGAGGAVDVLALRRQLELANAAGWRGMLTLPDELPAEAFRPLTQVEYNGAVGTIGDTIARQAWADLGHSIVPTQYRQGKALRGFDFLSFTEEGGQFKVFIHEVKQYRADVPQSAFTVFGLGKPRAAKSTVKKAFEEALKAIDEAPGLSEPAKRALTEALESGTARIVLDLGNSTEVNPEILSRISQSLQASKQSGPGTFIVGEGGRLP